MQKSTKVFLTNETLAIIILATLSLALYSNTFSAGYVWDDRAAIISNGDVQSSDMLQLWRHDFWGQDITLSDSHKSYRPLTVLSYRINYAIHQFRASGYHVTNVLLHIVVVTLFYIFSGYFTSPFGAFVAALLFAVHPVHVESVASLVGRADVLCGAFYLLALLCYHSYMTTGRSSNNGMYVLGAAYIFALCCSLAKELGFTIFGLFIVLDVLHMIPTASCAPGTGNTLMRHVTAFFRLLHVTATTLLRSPLSLCRMCLSLLYLVLLLFFRRCLHGKELYPWTIMENHITLLPTLHRVLSYAQTHLWYVIKLVYPYHLCFDYGYHCLPVIRSVINVLNLLPLIIYLCLVIALCYSFVYHRKLLFALVLWLFPLIPALNILFPVGTTLAERLLYIPSMGYCLAVAICLDSSTLIRAITPLSAAVSTAWKIKLCPKTMIMVFLVPILLSQCRVVIPRNREWYSEQVLFASALNVCPHSVKALNNHGMMELSFGNLTTARTSLMTALQVHPKQGSAYINLGIAEQRLGNYAASIYAQQQAIPLLSSAKPYGYMAQAMNLWSDDSSHSLSLEARTHLQRQAAASLQKAFELGWAPPSMLFLRANLYINANEPASAVPLLLQTLQLVQEAKKLDKDVPAQDMVSEIVIYNQLALCYLELNQDSDAEVAYLLAIDSDANRYEPHVNLASLYRSQQRYGEAIHHMQLAETILHHTENRVPLSVVYNFALLYIDSKRSDDAIVKLQEVQTICNQDEVIRTVHARQCLEAERLLLAMV